MEMSHADDVWCDNLCDFRLIDVRESVNDPIDRWECLGCGDRHTDLTDYGTDICIRGYAVCKNCYEAFGRTCRLEEKAIILRSRGYKVTAKMFEREAEQPEAKIGEILWQ